MQSKLIPIALTLFLAAVSESAKAQEVVKFMAIEDSMVKKSYPTKNYGKSTSLESNAQNNSESFIKFDVKDTNSISKVKIRLYVKNGSNDAPAVFAASNSWAESKLNYNNRPSKLSGELHKLGEVSSGSFVEYDVSSYVKSNGIFSFNFQSFSTDGAIFASRESSIPPALLVTHAGATSVPEPSTGKFEFKPVADATVKSGSSTSNYGTASILEVDGSPVAESFIKFTVNGLSGTVSSAKIRLFVTNGSSNGPSIYASGSSWSESTINYSNRPSRTSSKLDGKEAVSKGSFIEYDVSSAIKENGTYSFNLAGSSSDGVDFASRSASNPPLLIISTSGETRPTDPSEPTEPTEPTEPSNINFKTIDYTKTETDVYGQLWGTNQSAMLPHSVQKSQYGNIYRFEVNEGEQKASDTPGVNERSELQHKVTYPHGTEIWTSYSMKIEPGETITSRWVILGQMHAGNGKSPPLSFNTSNNILAVETLHGDSSSGTTRTVHTQIPLERGKWYNFVVKSKYGTYGKGSLQVWLNGQNIVNKASISMGYPDDSGKAYWKFGVYRKTHPANMAIQYANMENGTTNLSSRITSPKPIKP